MIASSRLPDTIQFSATKKKGATETGTWIHAIGSAICYSPREIFTIPPISSCLGLYSTLLIVTDDRSFKPRLGSRRQKENNAKRKGGEGRKREFSHPRTEFLNPNQLRRSRRGRSNLGSDDGVRLYQRQIWIDLASDPPKVYGNYEHRDTGASQCRDGLNASGEQVRYCSARGHICRGGKLSCSDK